MSKRDPRRTAARIERLRNDPQFGHQGMHSGNGTEDCPRERHHHHDWFCDQPTPYELRMAGRKRSEIRSRA